MCDQLKHCSNLDNVWLIVFLNAYISAGTDESTVIRIIGGFDHSGVRVLAERYQQKYDRSLSADIESELGGNLRRAVLRWLEANDCTEGLWEVTEQGTPTEQQLIDEQAALRRNLATWDTYLIQKACKGMGTDEKVSVWFGDHCVNVN